MANMIFHHPYLIFSGGNSGSQVRPYQMVQAFRNIGYDVDVVSGYGNERKKAINRIKKMARQGKQYDFMYSESSTMPTLLTEVHHFPTYPFLDFGFFRWAKKNSIPVGLFYRDIHWRFIHYTNSVALFKRAVSIPFYKYDWLQYKRLLDHLFLPALKMQEALPNVWNKKKISALPPGCHLNTDVNKRLQTANNTLRLFYVGGVNPPAYDLKPLFQTINGVVEGIHLTLCCRMQEWESVRNLYGPLNRKNVNIIHLSGSELQRYYEKVDVFALLWGAYEYLDFAMPVKVFESVGNGLPILTLSGTETARFVQREDVGWVVDTVDEAKNLLCHLLINRGEINAKRQRVLKVRESHTWEARAKTVVQILTNVKGMS